MVKMDSYMKEVIRFYPTGFTSFNRKVLRGFTLSNGQYIPDGVIIEAPSSAVYQDPSYYSDNADQFDTIGSAADVALEAVTDPTRWDLGNDYDLVIQFQPYEVAAYAYGAPTVTIPWERLESIKAPTQDDMRYGW